MDQDRTQDGAAPPQRRGFLRALGLATGVAAVAPAAAFQRDGDTGGLPPQKEGEAEKRKARYRETDHVRAFYLTNRY